jgi:hypothetical protein
VREDFAANFVTTDDSSDDVVISCFLVEIEVFAFCECWTDCEYSTVCRFSRIIA